MARSLRFDKRPAWSVFKFRVVSDDRRVFRFSYSNLWFFLVKRTVAPAHLCWHSNCHKVEYCQNIIKIIHRMIWQHFYDNAMDTSFISNLALFCIFDTLVEDRERRFDLFTLRSITARPPPPIKGKHGWVEWRKLWEGPFSKFKKCQCINGRPFTELKMLLGGRLFTINTPSQNIS